MEFFEKFLKYEKANKMYDKEIFNFKYWEYVRFVIYTEVKIQIGHLSPLLSMRRFHIKDYLFNIKEFNKYIGFSRVKKHDILFISHPRRIKQDNKYENIYTDEVERYISNKYNCLTLEEPCWVSFVASDRGHLFPVSTENIKYTDLYEINYLFKKNIYKRFNRKKYKLIDIEVTDILDKLNKEYNVDVMYVKPRVINAILYGIIMRKKSFITLKR